MLEITLLIAFGLLFLLSITIWFLLVAWGVLRLEDWYCRRENQTREAGSGEESDWWQS